MKLLTIIISLPQANNIKRQANGGDIVVCPKCKCKNDKNQKSCANCNTNIGKGKKC